ncbi:hypothetical protein DEU56DRAFT_815125 [Suillus clintonianus]|uniref:uncharacterized protein n=1 Tax=Suillus clintonianus TaxID=1904413 RepID=UPI001B88729C|nr:uncharacterized protein DEU56DRAFT_815125 [Suillus clintonianus]KAG2130685.1 hypothetical protein DEU56DRAFT_815125 [Suillus clintonianus]
MGSTPTCFAPARPLSFLPSFLLLSPCASFRSGCCTFLLRSLRGPRRLIPILRFRHGSWVIESNAVSSSPRTFY